MATYERRVLQVTRVEFHVSAPEPWGATWVEVSKAIGAVHAELVRYGELPAGAEAAADQIQVAPGDDVIVVSYERHVSASQPPAEDGEQ